MNQRKISTPIVTDEIAFLEKVEPLGNEPSEKPVFVSDIAELKANIICAIQEIYDPEIPVNIYDLGLIYSIEVNEKGSVQIKMTLTSPMCPVAETLPQNVQDRVLMAPGVSHVSVELVWDPPWTKDNMSDEIKLQLNLL